MLLLKEWFSISNTNRN